jgi:hypothetical protein
MKMKFLSFVNSIVQLYFITYFTNFMIVNVHSWGQKGHEIVGNVASALLSKDALDRIAFLLNVSYTNDTVMGLDGIAYYKSTKNIVDPHSHSCEEYCTPLAIVADWADQIRTHYHWSAPLHYNDVRDDIILPNGCPVVMSSLSTSKCYFNYTRDCPNNICVSGAIMNYTQQLQDGFYNNQQQLLQQKSTLNESLMFLVHFIGDIHQPLHSSRMTDRGGNNIHVHYNVQASPTKNEDSGKVKKAISNIRTSAYAHQDKTRLTAYPNLRHYYDSYSIQQFQRRFLLASTSHHHSLNLHAVWDDSIIETILERDFHFSRNAFEGNLLSYIFHTRTYNPSTYYNIWLKCSNATSLDCVSQWGEESFEYAMQFAYANVDGTEIVDGTELNEEYYTTRQEIVRSQLAIASVRLATNLEYIFGGTFL